MRSLFAVLVIFFAGCLSPQKAFAADVAAEPHARKGEAQTTNWSLVLSTAYVSDYNFRGISQSARHGSLWGSAEVRYDQTKDLQWYAGLGAETIDFPIARRSKSIYTVAPDAS